MCEIRQNDHETVFLVHGIIGTVFSMIIGSFCGLFGRPIKKCFLKGAVIPGLLSLGMLPVHMKERKKEETGAVSSKSLFGFSCGYSLFFFLSYSAFLLIRKFVSIFIRSLDR